MTHTTKHQSQSFMPHSCVALSISMIIVGVWVNIEERIENDDRESEKVVELESWLEMGVNG